MKKPLTTLDLDFSPADNQRLANLCGPLDAHLRLIEKRMAVEINNRGAWFQISGAEDTVRRTKRVLEKLYAETGENTVNADAVHLALQTQPIPQQATEQAEGDISIRTRNSVIRPRSPHQQQYLRNIRQFDLNFGIGPAGTGKTFLAVASAVQALEREEVQRLVLVRPAVEAGEKLGFLPGDLVQKIDPYLRPLYDALYEMLGFDRVGRLIEKNVIEVAPLAFMRGRTLNDAFIILDEAQNTTIEQMKMFLTRIGFGATAIVTGDVTQVDLPRHERSGLRHSVEVLRGVADIGITHFDNRDVVRHPLVQRIVQAYEAFEDQKPEQ
ncbi:MAG: PhoH family protein [Nevskiales bacterium]